MTGGMAAIEGQCEIEVSPIGVTFNAQLENHRVKQTWNQPNQNDLDSLIAIPLYPAGIDIGDTIATRCLSLTSSVMRPLLSPTFHTCLIMIKSPVYVR